MHGTPSDSTNESVVHNWTKSSGHKAGKVTYLGTDQEQDLSLGTECMAIAMHAISIDPWEGRH
jgi:hypothetical protein